MSRVGLFGGTFNPPHLGHKRLADEMMKKAALDEVIIMPTFVPPHKMANQLAISNDRLEMCLRTFSEEHYTVSDDEIKRGGKSYTYDTICELKKERESDRLFLIIGSDMLLSFHLWHRYRDILSNVTLCVISRSSDENVGKLLEYSKNILSLDEKNDEIIISEVEPFEISSTEIRRKIKCNEDVSAFVEKNTLDYILKKGLYL